MHDVTLIFFPFYPIPMNLSLIKKTIYLEKPAAVVQQIIH